MPITFILLSVIFLLTALLIAGYFVLRRKVEYYKALAMNDKPTGLPNRTAFEVEIKHIEDNSGKYASVACIIFDLNFLKITNDTFGHDAGDALIFGTGYCLKKTFERKGSFFRLGGDEFAVILKDFTEGDVAEIVNVLYENISEYNDSHEYKIDISWGVALGGRGTDIHKLLKLADERMYENKRKMKELL